MHSHYVCADMSATSPAHGKSGGFGVCTPAARNHSRECEISVQYWVR